jgi:predicted RecB family nuclease
MIITSKLFEAYLKCPTKCWLISQGETGLGNTYSDWFGVKNETYRSEAVNLILDELPQNVCVLSPPEQVNLKSATWRVTVDILAQANSMESRLHAVERIQFGNVGKIDQFIPICFVFTNKINQDDKLRVAFDALILSETLGREVNHGKIIHGDSHITAKLNTANLIGNVKKQIKSISELLSDPAPPDLVLIRYCAECEFQQKCRQMALEKDDLSLLTSMTRNERNQYRSKGIFTVNQLSYTFRPRRAPKRAKNPTNKHYPALQALAIREKTVFIHGTPNYPESKIQIYLDIEGMPDHDSYYLIGALVVSADHEKFHSYWANNESEESVIFTKFINMVSAMSDYTIYHYGDYEKLALSKMRQRLPEILHKSVDEILNHSVNILSLVYSHFYFPTYSNGLKDIGKILGYEWSMPVTGLDTIIWRTCWIQSKDKKAKTNLTFYNEDDCKALKLLYDFVINSKDPDKLLETGLPKTNFTQDILKSRPHWQLFAPRTYAIEDFKHISKCAYFDYQREKVFIRTASHIKALKKKKQCQCHKKPTRPNEVVNIEATTCTSCQSQRIKKLKDMSHDVIDLKFSKGGIRKCLTQFILHRYKCLECNKLFSSEAGLSSPLLRYGHGLDSWCVYLNNVCGLSFSRIKKSLGDAFGLYIPKDPSYRAKRRIREFYDPLYAQILQALLAEPVIHVDETTVTLRQQQKGYVWVLTSLDKVYYFYQPSRETFFIKEMLISFKGILISDFYTGYDSIPCEQQKCLIHFMRDLDDDVLHNPFDNELKVMAQEFGVILNRIINTIDKYGLKKRHLQKHKKDVLHFLAQLSKADYSSEIANKYKKRFEKSGKKMFTFLDHSGVPWNNNNAEHAIHHFAKHRSHADGLFSKQTLDEYLVMATVFETCEFNNVNVLQFLLSKVNTLDGLLQMARQKPRRSAPILTEAQVVFDSADS